ncbi:hypothetical protein HK104_010480 [Borealophlyctis nickersoniae]|nr:hypothetical protein HK104_010480 [Borealophlyctis nickersoniae]
MIAVWQTLLNVAKPVLDGAAFNDVVGLVECFDASIRRDSKRYAALLLAICNTAKSRGVQIAPDTLARLRTLANESTTFMKKAVVTALAKM